MDLATTLRVPLGAKDFLRGVDPAFHADMANDAATEALTAHNLKRLREGQVRLYAESKRGLLICLQGMDGAGKDGVVTHVIGAMNPMGCRVYSFKQPSAEERAHDFLWRIHKCAPARGWISVFNRSHYEGVLVERVHKLVAPEAWQARYRQINEFERLLGDNGVTILKFFLHIGKKEQLERFKGRMDDPAKRWKVSEADYAEREHWDAYQNAYEDALAQCSPPNAPWFVVPADHKWFRNFAVSQIVADAFDALKIGPPQPRTDLAALRTKYHVG